MAGSAIVCPMATTKPAPILDRRILRPRAAAAYIGLAVSTLERMRLDGCGLAFVRLGPRAVGYDVRELDRWIENRRRVRNDRGIEVAPGEPTITSA